MFAPRLVGIFEQAYESYTAQTQLELHHKKLIFCQLKNEALL